MLQVSDQCSTPKQSENNNYYYDIIHNIFLFWNFYLKAYL